MKFSAIKNKSWIQIIVIAVLIAIIFLKSLNFDFNWLDNAQIEKESCVINSQQSLKDVFLKPLLNPKGQGNYYRPLFKVSYTLDYVLYGKRALGFHITNILLHIVNLILLYFIFLALKIKKSISFLVVLFYGVLPLNVSTVVSLTARADLLVALFIFSSFLFYLQFQNRGVLPYLILSLAGYLLALMSKEMAFPFFILIFLISYIKNSFKSYSFLYLFLALGYLFIRFKILGYLGSSIVLLRAEPTLTVLSSFAGFYTYIFKFFIPTELSLSDVFLRYNYLLNDKVVLGIAITFLLCLALLSAIKRRDGSLSILLSWVLIFYIPISNIIPSPHFWAERFFYLPGAGLAGLIAYVILKKRWLKNLLIISILFYSLVNINYQNYFKDNEVIFKRALDISANSEEAYNMLGYHYILNGDYYRAIYYYHMATQDFSRYYTFSSLSETYNNLGVLFLRLKQYSEARKWFEYALILKESNKDVILNLKILNSLDLSYGK